MKKLMILFLLFSTITSLNAQDIYGYWEGIITAGKEQFKFELNIEKGKRTGGFFYCRSCQKLKGDIIDHRESEKIIDFFGIINKDESVNLVDTRLKRGVQNKDEIRTRYQILLEIKGGVPWLVGYYQDYNSKGRKVRQGKIYLKRSEQPENKA